MSRITSDDTGGGLSWEKLRAVGSVTPDGAFRLSQPGAMAANGANS